MKFLANHKEETITVGRKDSAFTCNKHSNRGVRYKPKPHTKSYAWYPLEWIFATALYAVHAIVLSFTIH